MTSTMTASNQKQQELFAALGLVMAAWEIYPMAQKRVRTLLVTAGEFIVEPSASLVQRDP